jgi:hypothetical protein
MVLETLVFSRLNQLTWLVTRENFIIKLVQLNRNDCVISPECIFYTTSGNNFVLLSIDNVDK